MGIIDNINAEDRIPIRFGDFYKLVKDATKAELMMNAINCDVPHRYTREMITGKKEKVIVKNESNKDYSSLSADEAMKKMYDDID